MDLLIIRHGIAMDRDEALDRAIGDKNRPLTRKGRSRLERIAKSLAKRAPGVRTIFTSSLLRAIETADIVANEYGDPARIRTHALLPEAEPDELASVLRDSAEDPIVAAVGHEPHLSQFVTWCVAGERAPILELKKGGACLVRFDNAASEGRGRLIWLAPPAILRHI